MKKGLLYGINALSDLNEIDINIGATLGELELPMMKADIDDIPEEVIFEMIEADAELREALSKLNVLEDQLTAAEESIGKLEHIKTTIKGFGISRSMMTVIDPEGELSDAGIIPAYESLCNTPEKDSHEATVVIEGIDTALEGIFSSISSFFEKISVGIGKFYSAILNAFAIREIILVNLHPKINNKNIDEEKLASKKARCIGSYGIKRMLTVSDFIATASDIKGTIRIINKISAEISKIHPDDEKDDTLESAINVAEVKFAARLKPLISLPADDEFTKYKSDMRVEGKDYHLVEYRAGLRIRIEDKRVIDVSMGKTHNLKRTDKFRQLVWNIKSINDAIQSSIDLLIRIRNSKGSLNELVAQHKRLSVETNQILKDKFGKNKYAIGYAKTGITFQKKILGYQRTMIQAQLRLAQKIAGNMILVAKLALKAKV